MNDKIKFKMVGIAVIFILCLASALATYYFLPRVERVSTEKFFVYDCETNTLTVYGGSKDNPMTWSDIQRAMRVLDIGASPTILVNTTIVIE